MDAASIQDTFQHFVLFGCLVAAALTLAVYFVHLAMKLPGLVARSAKRRGWLFVCVMAVFSAFATLLGTPTHASKDRGEKPQRAPERPAASVGTEETPTIRSLTRADYEDGLALSRIGTGETFDFSPPAGAIVCDEWLKAGAIVAWQHLSLTNMNFGQGFPLGTNVLDRLVAFASGTVRGRTQDLATRISPLETPLGIVPAANWNRCGGTDFSSRFWYRFTPSGSFVMTWQNALAGESGEWPVSIQAELFPKGDIVFRYDLSRYPGGVVSNVVVGVLNGGHGRVFSCIPTDVTSLYFAHLDPFLANNPDPDKDGITTEDELFIHHTDPYAADTDLDGLADADEIARGSDPNDPHSLDSRYPDGMSAVFGDTDPFSCPEGSTNTVFEHVFYTGTTNAPFAYPRSTAETAVLRVTVTGTGSGDLFIGDKIVPLLGAPSAAATRLRAADEASPASGNPLLIEVGRGNCKNLWFNKPEGLEVALDSDDLIIGRLPSLVCLHGWIAFPHVNATISCIHDLNRQGTTVSLVHGEEFPGLTATWLFDEQKVKDVAVTNLPPVSADVYGRFRKTETRSVSYEVRHPQMLNRAKTEFTFLQELRFCPQLPEEADPSSGESGSCPDDDDETYDDEEDDDPLPELPEMNADAAEAYMNAMETVEDEHVLYLYRANERLFHLDVPQGEPRHCCPCPEHWQSNYASAYHSPRLDVRDMADVDFVSTNESCDVRVLGAIPSRNVRDAQVCFVTNGVISFSPSFTVLGLDIKTEDFRPSLAQYNKLSSTFGYPITINTNLNGAAYLNVRSDILLTNGVVRLALENATSDFKVWLPNWWNYPPLEIYSEELLLDSEGRTERYLTMREWRSLLRRYGNSRKLELLITSSATGRTDLVVEYVNAENGRRIFDYARQRITSILPPLQGDYDHDGKIDERDDRLMLSGRPYRFWVNNEAIGGDTTDDLVKRFGSSLNSGDSKINGRYDLLNFFTLATRVSAFREHWGDDAKIRIRSPWDLGNYKFCYVDVPWERVGDLQTNDWKTVNGEWLHSAKLIDLSHDGSVIPSGDDGRFGISSGVVFAEAVNSNCSIDLLVEVGGREMYAFRMPLKIGDIRDMYRWLNLRDVCGDSSGDQTARLGSPRSYPDEECDGRNFVFVHGYNVNVDKAQIWADAIFKRLWHAGSVSMFTAVDWCGDTTQFSMPFYGEITPNYYINVEHAFASAPQLSERLKGLPGRKVVLAHSLGNVLASSAAVEHGMVYDRYYMLNAAVATEAYDASSFTSNMVDSAFRKIDMRLWSSNWWTLFEDRNDARRDVKWNGRFSSISNAVNCYSPTEEVLENPAAHGFGDVWAKQELFKGTTLWHGDDLLPGEDIPCEGGWGINIYYAADPRYYVPGYGFFANAFTNYTNEAAIVHPLFTPFDDDSLHLTNVMLTMSAEQKYKLLADAIPAISFAAGSNPIESFTNGEHENNNINYANFMSAGWPRTDSDGTYQWHHSDIKDIAYFFLSQFYRRIVHESKNVD